MRVIRARHDRMKSDPIEHPLLTPDSKARTHRSLTVEEEAEEFQKLRGILGSTLDPDKIHPATRRGLQQAPPEQGAVP